MLLRRQLINPHLADTIPFFPLLPSGSLEPVHVGFGIYSQAELGDSSKLRETCSLLLHTGVDLAKLALGPVLTKKMK